MHVRIKNIRTFYPTNSDKRDRTYISLFGDRWVYYIETDRTCGLPHELHEKASNSQLADDIAECRRYLTAYCRDIAHQLGIDFDEIARIRRLKK